MKKRMLFVVLIIIFNFSLVNADSAINDFIYSLKNNSNSNLKKEFDEISVKNYPEFLIKLFNDLDEETARIYGRICLSKYSEKLNKENIGDDWIKLLNEKNVLKSLKIFLMDNITFWLDISNIFKLDNIVFQDDSLNKLKFTAKIKILKNVKKETTKYAVSTEKQNHIDINRMVINSFFEKLDKETWEQYDNTMINALDDLYILDKELVKNKIIEYYQSKNSIPYIAKLMLVYVVLSKKEEMDKRFVDVYRKLRIDYDNISDSERILQKSSEGYISIKKDLLLIIQFLDGKI